MIRKLLLAAATSALLAGQAHADTTLRFVQTNTSDEFLAVLNTVIKKFEAENPGVKVEITSLPWGRPSRSSPPWSRPAISPDVVEMPDRWQSLYANDGMLESLEPYLAKWEYTRSQRASARVGALRQ